MIYSNRLKSVVHLSDNFILPQNMKNTFFLFLFCLIYQNTFAQKNTTLFFEHFFNGEKINLDMPLITDFGDTIYISKCQYYIGNIQNKNKTIKNNYFLIKLDTNKTQKITLKNFLFHEKINFSIGILPEHNQKNSVLKQKGDLDLMNGMFWTWESGYIFFKLEGYFFVKGEKKGLIFHLGRNESLTDISIQKNTTEKNNITIKINLDKFFPQKPLKEWTFENGISIMDNEKSKEWRERLKTIFQ